MQAEFWHSKWRDNQIGFHETEGNRHLKRNLHHLPVNTGATFFLPLCGKTRDIAWLISQGFRVIGSELSLIAVEALFKELDLVAEETPIGPLTRFHAGPITLFQGDIFDLTPEILGPVSAIYDRAALVALPHQMRLRYCTHLQELCPTAPRLLLTLSYDQDTLDGPPFSIPPSNVRHLFEKDFHFKMLDSVTDPTGLKGRYRVEETAWLLTPKAKIA